jgi:hypothetical protein
MFFSSYCRERKVILLFPLSLQIHGMLAYLIRLLGHDKENVNKYWMFLMRSGFTGIVSIITILLSWWFIHVTKSHDMRDPRFLDDGFEDLRYEPPEEDKQNTELERVESKRNWHIDSGFHYSLAARRLKEVMEYWQIQTAKGRSTDSWERENGVCDRWETYVSQLRQCLDSRKWALYLVADCIAADPEEAHRYLYVRTLCEHILELQEDTSRFWDQGWGDLSKGELKEWDKEKELQQISDRINGVVPEARLLMEFMKDRNSVCWATGNIQGFQITCQRLPCCWSRVLRY